MRSDSMYEVRDSLPTGPRADQYRGSNHDYYHGLDPPPANNAPNRRRGRSPVMVSHNRTMDRRRSRSRSRSRSPHRYDDTRNDRWSRPSRPYPNGSNIYRPNYDSSSPRRAVDKGEGCPRVGCFLFRTITML